MKIYVYTGKKFPSEQGKKVAIIGKLKDKLHVKVVDEKVEIDGVSFGMAFLCNESDLEREEE